MLLNAPYFIKRPGTSFAFMADGEDTLPLAVDFGVESALFGCQDEKYSRHLLRC